jgi:hypothetical protein
MKKPTIYDIKRETEKTSPYFFSRKTLKFFGQTMKDFKVYTTEEDGKYLISSPMWDRFTGRNVGTTQRIYNSFTKELEYIRK